jgi:hypothetical protein
MKLLKVTFGVETLKKGEAFMYFATQREARQWITDESPHELTMDYEQDVEEVEVPTTKKGLADYLNTHHVYW